MDIFSLVDHKLSGGGFGWVGESVCVCVCLLIFFSALNLTLISVLILIACLDSLEGFDV